ncbi:unnamed protein product, partial [Candidula unifasciata]
MATQRYCIRLLAGNVLPAVVTARGKKRRLSHEVLHHSVPYVSATIYHCLPDVLVDVCQGRHVD